MDKINSIQKFSSQETLYPGRVRRLLQAEWTLQILGVLAIVLHHGVRPERQSQFVELGLISFFCMMFLAVSTVFRSRWHLQPKQFQQENRVSLWHIYVWVTGLVGILLFAPLFDDWGWPVSSRLAAEISFSELILFSRGLITTIVGIRSATVRGWSPALILVGSFLLLVAVGTVLLMLPRSRAVDPETGKVISAPFRTALFTATSASCVTGLAVESTGTYWSRFGQIVILCLFQLGGLGIMTCGAFFTVAGGNLRIKESATLRDLFESDQLGDVRMIVKSIVIFTFGTELLAAFLISGLWSGESLGEQFFQSLFHSVSAFCNAGFSLTDNSFTGWGTRWEIWGVVSMEIIIGGLGFAVLYNLAAVSREYYRRFQPNSLLKPTPKRVRLNLTSKLVLISTGLLLLGGTVGYFLLESIVPSQEPMAKRVGDAWFQSVTFRTAGFNTVDHGNMQPGTKLMAIGLMFIGASPGSTGGGIKTVCFVVMVLALISVLRGRNRLEIFGRTIPEATIYRALSIMSLGLLTLMVTTLLLIIFEQNEALFLDHLFEATSAFATVGVSTGITSSLKPPSQYLLIVAMFLGRVGPLTLMLALTSNGGAAHYEYPKERVLLG